MAALSVLAPYPIFNDRDGQPIDNGRIYIGTVNLDPVANPIQVYWDEALTIPAAQPINTLGGYPVYQGTPSTLYINGDDFSITVKDSQGLLVYTALQASLRLNFSQVSGDIPSERVSTPEGSLYNLLYDDSALPLARGSKWNDTARSWAEAVEMCDDHSALVGYAKDVSLTTGGAGKTIYKVWNQSDNGNVIGSFRWALAQAIANNGGRIIFVPIGKFTITVRSLMNVSGNNITIDAPGRNVELVALNNVEMLRLSAQNIIVRRLRFSRLPGYTHVDGGNIYERDALNVDPTKANKLWIDQCIFTESSDGALDMASSALNTTINVSGLTSSAIGRRYIITSLGTTDWNVFAGTTSVAYSVGDPVTMAATDAGTGTVRSGNCYVSITRNITRRQDKGWAFGSSATSVDPAPSWAPTALDEEPCLFVTAYQNVFDGCAQRGPRVGALAFVHSVNNIHILSGYHRDDGTVSACYGVIATTGGKVRSVSDYAVLGSPYTSGIAYGFYADTAAWDDTTNIGPGALVITDSFTGTGLVSFEANTSYVPVPPYTLTPDAIPASDEAKQQFVYDLYEAAGSDISPLSEMVYTFVDTATGDANGLYADGYFVVTVPGGYRVRTYNAVEASGENTYNQWPESINVLRGSSLTVASGDVTLNGELFFALTPEVGNSDDITSIVGTLDLPLTDGQLVYFRPSSASYSLTLKPGGNLNIPGPITLGSSQQIIGLRYSSSTSKWSLWPGTLQNEGSYTPTLTGVTNVTGTPTISSASYSHIPGSNYVNVYFSILVVTAAAALTDVGISLPIASNIGSGSDISGSGAQVKSNSDHSGAIIFGDATNDRATIRFAAAAASTYGVAGSFRYKLI